MGDHVARLRIALQLDQQAGQLGGIFGVAWHQIDRPLHLPQRVADMPGFGQRHAQHKPCLCRLRIGAADPFGNLCRLGKITLQQCIAGLCQHGRGTIPSHCCSLQTCKPLTAACQSLSFRSSFA